MKGVPLFFFIFSILHILGEAPANAFLIHVQNQPAPLKTNTKRKLSILELFSKKPPTPTYTTKGGASGANPNSVNNVMQLLQMADSFSNDPNLSVQVQVNYKNGNDVSNSTARVKERRLKQSDDNGSTKKKNKKTKAKKSRKETQKPLKQSKLKKTTDKKLKGGKSTGKAKKTKNQK